MRKSILSTVSNEPSGIKQKHATPVAKAEDVSVALSEVRPSSVFPDRESFNIAGKDVKEILALREHHLLDVNTGKELIESWKTSYFATAFPFSLGRAVGGADFPKKRRERRTEVDAPLLDPLSFARLLATRVEASIRNDWIVVPAARNMATKFKALCGDDAACRHPVDLNKPGVELAADLTEAAAGLYHKLEKGYWWDSRKKQKINHDVTKLRYALELTPKEKDLVTDLTFLSGTCAGTQEIREQIGQCLFGARVEFGDPLFITISPSSRHSAMTLRLSRYRRSDPAMLYDRSAENSVPAWAGIDVPKIWQELDSEDVGVDIPPYTLRRIMAARDPSAVMQSFTVSIKFLLARLLGMRMCPECPHCNKDGGNLPCSNAFGHNMLPLGGIMGLAVALGGCVEYQGNDNPHFHGNVHLATVYQYKTLWDIAQLIQKNILKLEDFTDFQDWICHEDPFNLEDHNKSLDDLEQKWCNNNSDASCNRLCNLPSYLRESNISMWLGEAPCTIPEAITEGLVFRQKYFADAQYVFSHCHHHWHPRDAKTKERHPIRGCRAKTGKLCKAGFPQTKRLSVKPKVICPDNARKHDVRVAGRRNALGAILSKRRCEWMSGTAPGFAVFFRHNTHTGPNYRVPLLRETHDPECTAKCITEHSLERMMAAAQRAQRNTTGYYTGYIQKRQPVGKFELRQATQNLRFLAKTIEKRSNPQQYHHVANRLLGDLEYRGHVRPATEETNLAANHKPDDVTFAEFLRTFTTKPFYGGPRSL